MTYHKDGSPYRTKKNTARRDIVYYGWLCSSIPFQKTAYPQDFTTLERLSIEVATGFTKGFHICELCHWENPSHGNGELWIKINKTIYVLPRMVWHYVKEHFYKLPDDFMTALSVGRFRVLTDDEINQTLQDTVAKTVPIPCLIYRIMWKESRYENLTHCVGDNQGPWGIGHATLKDGYYISTIMSLPSNIDILFENDPDSFPDRIEIIKD